MNEVEAACCADGCASGAAPSQCNIGCALVYIPFWTEVRLSVFADVVVG